MELGAVLEAAFSVVSRHHTDVLGRDTPPEQQEFAQMLQAAQILGDTLRGAIDVMSHHSTQATAVRTMAAASAAGLDSHVVRA